MVVREAEHEDEIAKAPVYPIRASMCRPQGLRMAHYWSGSLPSAGHASGRTSPNAPGPMCVLSAGQPVLLVEPVQVTRRTRSPSQVDTASPSRDPRSRHADIFDHSSLARGPPWKLRFLPPLFMRCHLSTGLLVASDVGAAAFRYTALLRTPAKSPLHSCCLQHSRMRS